MLPFSLVGDGEGVFACKSFAATILTSLTMTHPDLGHCNTNDWLNKRKVVAAVSYFLDKMFV